MLNLQYGPKQITISFILKFVYSLVYSISYEIELADDWLMKNNTI